MKPAWLDLFAHSEPDATVDLLPDPERFISRANEICKQLEEYVEDQRRKSYTIGQTVRTLQLTDARQLLVCLTTLRARAEHPERYLPEYRSIAALAPELIKRWEAFLIEGGPELINEQSQTRKMYKQRETAFVEANENRVAKAVEDHADWQTWADEVWAKRPELYKENVAREIIDTHKIKAAVGTVADILKKP